jgi:succinate dehydrogenase / fumarate reductase, iron-sulfur subunit
MMKITLKIQRFNPETDDAPFYREYSVDVEPTARVLDVLMQVKEYQDNTIAFRKSCAHGVCGSDAMRINGKEGLACKTLVNAVAKDDGDTIVLEPLRNFPVQRDLIVDQTSFFEKYRSVKPYLINDDPVIEKERLQTQEERMFFDDSINCILCSSCYSACPVMAEKKDFLGPAAIVQAFRFLGDSRDNGFRDRLPVLDKPDGVWPCENHFECTRQCPRSILITKRINQTKNIIKKYRNEHREGVQDK